MIILIDNYDSFTWNLYHFLGDLGQKVKVFRNDKVKIDKLIDLKPKGHYYLVSLELNLWELVGAIHLLL